MPEKRPLFNPFGRQDLRNMDFGFWTIACGAYAALAGVVAFIGTGMSVSSQCMGRGAECGSSSDVALIMGTVIGIGGYVVSVLLAHSRDRAAWMLTSFVTTTAAYLASTYITNLSIP